MAYKIVISPRAQREIENANNHSCTFVIVRDTPGNSNQSLFYTCRMMSTSEIIDAIDSLPLSKKFLIVEETIKSIKKEELHQQMEQAAKALYDDYTNDTELTAFTILDCENFYEAKRNLVD